MKKIQLNTLDPTHRQSIFKIIKKKQKKPQRAQSQSIYSRFKTQIASNESHSLANNAVPNKVSPFKKKKKPKLSKFLCQKSKSHHKISDNKSKKFMIRTINPKPTKKNNLKKLKLKKKFGTKSQKKNFQSADQDQTVQLNQKITAPKKKSIWSIITTDVEKQKKNSISSMRRRGAISVHSHDMKSETDLKKSLNPQKGKLSSDNPLMNSNIPEIVLNTEEIEESNRLFDFLEKKFLLAEFDLLNRASEISKFENEIESENERLYAEFESLETQIESVQTMQKSQIQSFKKIEKENLEKLIEATGGGAQPKRAGRPRIVTRDDLDFGQIDCPLRNLESRLVKWKRENQKLDGFITEVMCLFLDQGILNRELPGVQEKLREKRNTEKNYLGIGKNRPESIGLKTIRFDVREDQSGSEEMGVTSIQSNIFFRII